MQGKTGSPYLGLTVVREAGGLGLLGLEGQQN